MSQRHDNVEAAGQQQDADWYNEWYVEDGTVRSRGWTPLVAIDHDTRKSWERSCLDAVRDSINPAEYDDGTVVFRSWINSDEPGVHWESVDADIRDPEVAVGGGQ